MGAVGLYSDAFLSAVKRTLRWEGGAVNDPVDRGGATRFGITGRTLTRYNRLTRRTLKMETLTHDNVLAVYHLLFWQMGRIDEMPAWSREFMFDWMVHSGPYRATKLMQQVLGVTSDGLLGPRTLGALERAGRLGVYQIALNRLAIRRMRHLCGIVQHNPTQSRFIKGWWRRVSSFIS